MTSSDANTPASRGPNEDRRLRAVLIRGKPSSFGKQMETHLRSQFDLVAVDERGEVDLTQVDADLAFVLGGDGSILRAAHRMQSHQLPIVGVNLGRLGFLADLSPEASVAALPDLARGDYRVVEHLMFRTQVFRERQCVVDQLGLNETAVLAGEPFAMLDIDLYVDAELVTTYSCDGLILSTPVGSTAHSLSAGGPILRKELQAVVVSPISPHTLTMRPVVDASDRVYEMVVHHPNAGTAVVVDGQLVHRVLPEDRVRVEQAGPRFKLVEVTGRSYYRTLREKLGWGGRIRKLNSRGHGRRESPE